MSSWSSSLSALKSYDVFLIQRHSESEIKEIVMQGKLIISPLPQTANTKYFIVKERQRCMSHDRAYQKQ